MITITYFVHGTTTDNEQHLSSGWKDAELSPLGVKQSKELPQQNTTRFDAVFCSDLRRSKDSATLSFGDTYPILTDERLRECNYGDYNGESSAIVEPLQEQMIHDPFPNGESYDDVKNRVEDFLKELTRNHDGQHIAIVAHKAPQLALDVLVKGMTWQQALANDWRKTGAWQPGWDYKIK